MYHIKIETASNLLLDCIQSTTQSFTDFNNKEVYVMNNKAFKEVQQIINFDTRKHTIKLIKESEI